MRERKFTRATLALAALLMLSSQSAAQTPAQEKPADLGAFTKEIMALKIEGGQQHLVMWLPYEFFIAAGMSDGTVTRESIEREMGFLKSYITMFIMSSQEKADGTEVFATESEVRTRAAIKLADGTEVKPLMTVPPKVAAIVAVMKAFMAQQGGADRENMHVLVFPAATPQGKPVVDTARKDMLKLQLAADARFRAASFTWRTPFDALTSVPDCPRCKAGLSAKWSYCPFCGQKISN